MKEELLKIIKSRGYWRINFQPVVITRIDKLEDCKKIVEKSAVSLSGWDFPHVPRRNDEIQGFQPCGDFFEAWTDTGARKEFWRIYKSAQFLFYKAFHEDWYAEDKWYSSIAEKVKANTVLATISSIYKMTEIFEFLSRLIDAGLYKEGVLVKISLHNTENRELWFDDSRRSRFQHSRTTGAKELILSKTFSKDEIITNSKEIANMFLLQLFDSFGWNPSPEQIMADQQELLSGKV